MVDKNDTSFKIVQELTYFYDKTRLIEADIKCSAFDGYFELASSNHNIDHILNC